MKLSPEEKAARKAAFRAMSPAAKADHIFTYYKWPIILGLITLLIVGTALHRKLTERQPVLYTALVNVAVGSDLQAGLTDGFLAASGYDANRVQVYLYADLYLSQDADTVNQQYAYASKMKVMGAVEAKKLDVVIMNREGYDLLSSNGYLMDLADLLVEKHGLAENGRLAALAAPYLTENQVVLSNNLIEYQLNETESHVVATEAVANGLLLTELPAMQRAGITEPVYLGIIANSQRTDTAAAYMRYLLETP
ncbi:MAG: hypothetical protein IJJ88_01065 [Oscillospiraceae bacterium]|nr:hypothetical protein [Oscillospiraceae bacterium]